MARLLVQLETWVVAVLRYALLLTDDVPDFGLAPRLRPVSAAS